MSGSYEKLPERDESAPAPAPLAVPVGTGDHIEIPITGLPLAQNGGFEYEISQSAMPRLWRSHFCCFIGDCSSTDFGSCLLACCCPCFAFGQNMARALNLSWRTECLKFLGLMLGLSMLDAISWAACKDVYLDTTEIIIGPDGMPEERHVKGLDCGNLVVKINDLIIVGLAVFLAVWAGGRRTAIRERFGIPGSQAWDAISWLCCQSCALSQETRTLAHNNVVDGVWHGPLVAPPVPGSLPGVPARMDVWDRVAPCSRAKQP